MQSHVYMNYAEQSDFTKSKSRFKKHISDNFKTDSKNEADS